MKNSRKSNWFILLFYSFFGLFIIPNANSYTSFYDLALIPLKNALYPDICLLSDDVVFKGNAYGPTTDTYFYLTTLINSNGIFQNPSDVLLGKDSPKYVGKAYLSTGDLNDDGHIDVVATSINLPAVFILFQKTDSSGAFDAPLVAAVSGTPQKTAIGDLNADGLDDIAVSGKNGNLSILLNDALEPGNFLTPILLNYNSIYVEIGDLNADLHNDIALAGTDNVLVLFQDPLNPGDYVETLSLTAGARPSCVKIADMDNDGFQDIVACFRGAEGTHDTGSISIFFQDPTTPGTFLSTVTYSLSCEALDIDVGDLNSDGLLDIAVANECVGDNPIKLFFHNKNDIRAFSEVQSYLFVENSWSLITLKIADMDQDNRNDIVVVSGQNVTILFQSGSIAGDFSDKNVIMKAGGFRSSGNGSGGGGGGGGCFISVILP